MSRKLLAVAFFAVSAFNNFNAGTLAQDAQAGATAKAARQQAASDSSRSALDIATPTDVAAPKRDDSALAPQTEQLKRRAGEQTGSEMQGRTLILGMKVQEADHGSVKVVDVGAATPAYEGGIRKGDQIASFQNFKANDYRKWIDGIRRIATGAKDGDMLAVVVIRDGNPLTTKIRVPESHVGPIQLPLGPPPGQQQQGASSTTTAAPGGDAVGIANTNVAIEESGPFADFFGGQNGAASERGVAELYRVASEKVDPNDGSAQKAAAQRPRGARIGLAGFRNSPNGMVVMVDVGGLEPGNYSVGIGDPTAAMKQVPTDVENSNGKALPAPTQTQSSSESIEISRNVLADVAKANTAPGVTAPATGQINPITAPATGAVNPTNTTPLGESTVNNAQLQERNKQNAKPAGATGINEIGTLTIDQSGTGRMQHVVEGIRVRNVVGQALIISTSITPATKTFPPNLDSTVDPAANKTENSNTAPSVTPGNSLPAAAGIIRLISDRGPAPPTGGQPGRPGVPSVPANPSIPAPAAPQR